MPNTTLGKVSITPRGEYSPTATYARLDAVRYGGSLYIVLKDCTGVTPEDGEYYMLSAEKGDKGDVGATPNLTIGEIETLEPGSSAEATITGTQENPVLNFGIPLIGVDNTFTDPNAAAPAKATGDAFRSLSDNIYADLANRMKKVTMSESIAADTYAKLLTNLPSYSMCYIQTTWFDDIDVSGTCWVFTYETSPYGYQVLVFPATNETYSRRITSISTGTWGAWSGANVVSPKLSDRYTSTADLDDVTMNGLYYISSPNTYANLPYGVVEPSYLWVFVNGTACTQFVESMKSGVTYVRYKVGTNAWTHWVASDNHDHFAQYFAFGDSTTYGQIGDAGGQSPYNYPACVGRWLHMKTTNKGVEGQGLIKDWDYIQENYIEALDMSNAKLITVGWAYNDSSLYGNYNFGSYQDTEDTTVIGKYYTIMKQFQQKCQNATVILITGYGYSTIGEQFTHNYSFADGAHTVKELYDELEKMCNLHGWQCVNQSNGCWVNEFTWESMIGDNIHPTRDGYLAYGNYMAARVGALYCNLAAWTD